MKGKVLFSNSNAILNSRIIDFQRWSNSRKESESIRINFELELIWKYFVDDFVRIYQWTNECIGCENSAKICWTTSWSFGYALSIWWHVAVVLYEPQFIQLYRLYWLNWDLEETVGQTNFLAQCHHQLQDRVQSRMVHGIIHVNLNCLPHLYHVDDQLLLQRDMILLWMTIHEQFMRRQR